MVQDKVGISNQKDYLVKKGARSICVEEIYIYKKKLKLYFISYTKYFRIVDLRIKHEKKIMINKSKYQRTLKNILRTILSKP